MHAMSYSNLAIAKLCQLAINEYMLNNYAYP